MNKLEILDGYKTYIFVALLIIIEVLNGFELLSGPVANSLEVFLGAGGLAALRHGISKS